jgi:hypothetical protein
MHVTSTYALDAFQAIEITYSSTTKQFTVYQYHVYVSLIYELLTSVYSHVSL